MRDIVAAVLENKGYTVRCAENGAQALAFMHGPKPEAIITDLMMPVMSGWEFLEALRGEAELACIPVVVLSVVRGPAGVAHLPKPVSADELITVLDRVCRH